MSQTSNESRSDSRVTTISLNGHRNAKQDQYEAITRCLDDAINSLGAEQIFNHPAHNFKQSGNKLKGGCPFHESKSGSSFVVTISSKLFWCEGCQSGGGAADYRASLRAGRWIKARGKDFTYTAKELAAEANIPFPELEFSPESIAKAEKWERRRTVIAETQNYCQEVLWSDRVEALEARQYLVSERGLTEEEIKLLPIGYYPNAGEIKRHLVSKGFSDKDWKNTGCVWHQMEGYITFLWNDDSGRPLTIYGRYFQKLPPDGKPKTIALPGAKTKQSPLFFDVAFKAGHEELVSVEGVLDAVLLQAKGDTRVCAYVAASCSNDQIATLKRRGIKKLTLCGDPDHGGERGTNSNVLRLAQAGITSYVAPTLPEGLDPDEFLIKYGMEGWQNHINSAEHGFRWKAKRLLEAGDVTCDKGKAEILENATAFCKAIGNHPDLDPFFWSVIRPTLGMEPPEFQQGLEKLWESSPVEVAEIEGDRVEVGKRENSDHKPTRQEIKSFCQEMYDALFAPGAWIYVAKQLYEWQDTHYEPVDNAVIIKKIHDYCDTYQELQKAKGKAEQGEDEENYIICYPYADPKYVNKAFEWLKQKVGIDPKLINPPGLNCVDGVLQLSYDPDSQKWIKSLVPHDPSFYYLYAPQVSYEIPALLLPDSCDRLLSCLDAPERDIFLKTIAASLDLPTVRRYRGREVKALLLHGTGNNGKDTLREVTAMMFGYRGMVGATLSDFQQYDQGRKFPLQKLDGANINWPSENADCMMIDRIQSLKIAVTGDPLAGEKKGKDEYQFRPRCAHLFNVNALPKLQGALEAIISRFCILGFKKTYKSNPAPGELQADPRFLYNPEFVRIQLLPWYLHYCLDALDRLMIEGINYDVTEQAWEDLREETDHIYSFCKEVGIGYKPNGYLSADQVYACLRKWYIENGTLEIEEFYDGRKKDHWSPNPAWGDSLVKASNQIFRRLLKLFPEARRERDSSGRNILVGIGWVDPTPLDPHTPENVSEGYTSERLLNVSEDALKMVKASEIKGSERAEDDSPICGENKNWIDQNLDAARKLADDWMRCNDASEVIKLTAPQENIKPRAWKLLTEEGKNWLRSLMCETGKESEISKNELPPSNHVQDVQNPLTMRFDASSEDIQASSEDVQNCIRELQNNATETIDIEQPDSTSVDEAEEVLTEEWEDEANLNDMAKDLLDCSSIPMLCTLLNAWINYPKAKDEACKRLSAQKQEQIKEWEAELDELKASFKVGDRVFVNNKSHTDKLGPYSIERIQGYSAKLECFASLISITDLRRDE
ncbi:MAG: hypothetical protein KME25_32445 [Symplocastrum torsivum CPER-KK1]|uniref:SF3 helicase domain-containing protein n=1 Tax=Symplocastrum torsivum CPER-KK1 TaxID=450513 RepID=A0A951PTH5_9CYAN|nr:hypothetical protein [Symplocastrum torsivum CPER-KK1]